MEICEESCDGFCSGDLRTARDDAGKNGARGAGLQRASGSSQACLGRQARAWQGSLKVSEAASEQR